MSGEIQSAGYTAVAEAMRMAYRDTALLRQVMADRLAKERVGADCQHPEACRAQPQTPTHGIPPAATRSGRMGRVRSAPN